MCGPINIQSKTSQSWPSMYKWYNHIRYINLIQFSILNCIKTNFTDFSPETCAEFSCIPDHKMKFPDFFLTLKNDQSTVKPVYKDRPRDQKQAVFIDKWITVRIALLGHWTGGPYKQVVFIHRWFLGQVRLYWVSPWLCEPCSWTVQSLWHDWMLPNVMGSVLPAPHSHGLQIQEIMQNPALCSHSMHKVLDTHYASISSLPIGWTKSACGT